MAVNENPVTSFPRVVEAQDSVTRPNNTTAYTAGDAISDNATTPTAAGYFALDVDGGGVTFTTFTLHKSDQDQTNCAITVLLFTVPPAFAGWEDNAASAITDAEMLNCRAAIPFTAAGWSSCGTGDIQTVALTVPLVCAAGVEVVYGIMIAQAAYEPGASEILTLTASGVKD